MTFNFDKEINNLLGTDKKKKKKFGAFKVPGGYKMVRKNGIFYYKDKERTIPHRLNGPAKIFSDRKVWYKDGLLHRENGPAIEYVDTNPYKPKEMYNQWYYEGEFHRLNGPAYTDWNGTHYCIFGKEYEPEKYIEKIHEIKAMHSKIPANKIKSVVDLTDV